ncbi:MAG: hypothetical protein KGS00_08395 [Alphaproteobacteria bacterium]|nr:hypothetical protein [Alphaproteobacteria bacterium]
MTVRFGAVGLLWLSVCAPLATSQTPSPSGPSSAAPPYAAPRTSFGHPSLEGVWTQNFIIMMEASDRIPMLTLPEPAAQAAADAIANGIAEQLDKALDPEVPAAIRSTDGFPIVRGERRTRVVVAPADGKLPYTPEVRKELSSRSPQRYDNPEERPFWERCITSLGLPPVTGVGTTSANPRAIIQTPGFVVLHTEYGDEARIIPFTDTHRPKALHTVLGDSIARWEGDTLVIETISLPENERIRAFSDLVVPAESKVIERFTRLSENELLYQYTIEDPKAYRAPWLAEYSLYRTDQRMFEHACHEGNYSLPNILKGARAADARGPR